MKKMLYSVINKNFHSKNSVNNNNYKKKKKNQKKIKKKKKLN